MTHAESMEQLANRFVAAVEEAQRGELDALYTRDAVVWHNYDNLEQSRDDNIAMLEAFRKTVREFKYANIRRSFYPGGYVQQHRAQGIKVSGEKFDVPVCMVIAVRGEQIARIDEYFDSRQDARAPDQR
jgi:ketosteroid isomerase-like protein